MNLPEIIFWDADSRKWKDAQNNDVFCSEVDGNWEVRHRYRFHDDTSRKQFPNERAALAFMVSYLVARGRGDLMAPIKAASA